MGKRKDRQEKENNNSETKEGLKELGAGLSKFFIGFGRLSWVFLKALGRLTLKFGEAVAKKTEKQYKEWDKEDGKCKKKRTRK